MSAKPASTRASVELHDAISLLFSGGAIGSVAGGSSHLGAGANKHSLELRAIGSRGQLMIDLEREAVWHFFEGKEERLSLSPGEGTYDCRGPVDTILSAARGEDFANCSPPELGARTVEALEVAYRSAETLHLERRRS